jgi:hypothetical protein
LQELLLQQGVPGMHRYCCGSDDAEAKKQIMRECGFTLWILQLKLVKVKEVLDNLSFF